MERALKFRKALLEANSVTFNATVTADFEDTLQSFQLNCQLDSAGQMNFKVMEPDSISGISGVISHDSGKIVFDDKALFFDTLADGLISPVSAPWVMMLAIKSGYIKGAGFQDEGYLIQVDDSYKENALSLNLQMNGECMPIRAEIFYSGRRVVSITLENFTML